HRKFIRRSRLPIPGPASKQSDGNSSAATIPDDITVVLLDSIGELASLYGLADGAFVGGSLVSSGGHNILEPAAFGKIPVFGPSMENFAEIASRFVTAGAAIQVESPEDVGVAWIELFRDPERMKRMSETARQLVANSRGATDRAMVEIAKRLDGAANETSDEIELMKFRLQGRVSFGVGKDRFAEGHRLESQQPIDVFILDDGFQHLQLARDLDILLMDVSRPLARESLLPAGRL